MAGVVGCRSSSGSKPAPAIRQYEYSASSNDRLVVVPQASKIVDLGKPDVSTQGNSIVLSGTVRLRTSKYNPDAVVRIVIVDRHGNQADEIRAALTETDSLGTLTYRAHFGPIPAKGSTVLLSYDDFQPVADYASGNLGSGGNSTPGGTAKGASNYSGSGSNKTPKPSYGGPTKQGSRGPR